MADTIVIFGASGDLTSRKLIPALYQLFVKGRLPEASRIVGVSRSDFEHQQWRDALRKTTAEFAGDTFDNAQWARFSETIVYQPGDITNPADFVALGGFLESIESGECGRVYYLSTMPQLYETAITNLGDAGLSDDSNGFRRVIIEKPFGTDLKTAKPLNQSIHSSFRETRYTESIIISGRNGSEYFCTSLCKQHF